MHSILAFPTTYDSQYIQAHNYETLKYQTTWNLLSLSPDGSIRSHLLVNAFSGSWSNNSQSLEQTMHNESIC